MAGGRKDTIVAIDLLRFTCAVLVVAYHLGVALWLTRSPHAAILLSTIHGSPVGGPLAEVGWIGVELFFVISGLVIANSATGVSANGFLRKRALRLVPAAWTCATITLAALLSSGLFGLGAVADWGRSVAFWPFGDQIDASYWTLAIEVSFYLLVAVAIGRAGSTGRIERVAIGLGAASTAFWVWCWWNGQALGPIPGNRYAMLMLFPHGCFFAIGILIALLHERIDAARIATLGILVVVGLGEVVSHTADRALVPGAAPSAALACALLLGGIALLLGAQRLQPLLIRWIPAKRARTIGLMTYPLYLLHQDMGAAVVARAVAADVPIPAALLLAVVLVVLTAWAVALAIEPALRRMLDRLISRHVLRRDIRPSASLPAG